MSKKSTVPEEGWKVEKWAAAEEEVAMSENAQYVGPGAIEGGVLFLIVVFQVPNVPVEAIPTSRAKLSPPVAGSDATLRSEKGWRFKRTRRGA